MSFEINNLSPSEAKKVDKNVSSLKMTLVEEYALTMPRFIDISEISYFYALR